MSRARGRGTMWSTVVVALVAGTLGGVIGALAGSAGRGSPATGLPDAGEQDVILCTTYALVKRTVREDREDGATSVLAAIPPLRLGLAENPDADPRIREAVLGAVEALDAVLAKGANAHGLSRPPGYDPAEVTAAWDRMARVCELDASG